MTTLRKVEFYLVDFDDGLDKEEIAIKLENCFMDYGLVEMSFLKSKNIGEWNDDHKFNLTSTPIEEYEKEFEEKSPTNKTIRDLDTKTEYSEDYYYQAIRKE